MKHNWEYLLLCGLDFKGFKFYIIEREKFVSILPKLNAGQGGKNADGIAEAQQGYWFTKSDFTKKNLNFEDYFIEIFDEEDLIKYINQFIN